MTIEEYVDLYSSPEPVHLKALERESYLRMIHGRMCSGHLQGRLLKMLTAMVCPHRVLELGTFTGYSGLCIAEGLPSDGKLITIEANDELEDFILEGFAKSPCGEKIELRIGRALEIMAEMEPESFDMIFMDADKREYPAYYEACKRLLRPGGFLLADNTLWDGHVVEERQRDAQTAGILSFNEKVASDSETEQVILPLRDGLTLIRKLNG